MILDISKSSDKAIGSNFQNDGQLSTLHSLFLYQTEVRYFIAMLSVAVLVLLHENAMLVSLSLNLFAVKKCLTYW